MCVFQICFSSTNTHTFVATIFLTMHKLQFTQHRFRVASFLSRINQTSEKFSLVYLLENFVNFEGEIVMSAKDYQLMQEILTAI